MSAHLLTSAYRLAICLYPKAFRDEFRDDLVLLFTDQLADEGRPRVCARTAVDFALSLPLRHLESHMQPTSSLSSPSIAPVLFGALAFSALAVGLVVGHPAILGACAVVALGSGGLGLVAANRSRRLSEPHPMSARWFPLLAAGVALLAGLIVVTRMTGELPSGGWLAAMVTGLTAVLLIGAGLVLGTVHFAGRAARNGSA